MSGSSYAGLTLREARTRFLAEYRLPPDGDHAVTWWSIDLAALRIHLPNFAWRRRALACHDLHHIVTGYECSPMGEIQTAAWEFSAGCFPSPLATAFYLPLVAVGAVFAPKVTFAAFLRGRQSTTVYAAAIDADLLGTEVGALSSRLAPVVARAPSLRDVGAYCWLVFRALSLIVGPCLAGILMLALAQMSA